MKGIIRGKNNKMQRKIFLYVGLDNLFLLSSSNSPSSCDCSITSSFLLACWLVSIIEDTVASGRAVNFQNSVLQNDINCSSHGKFN